MKDPQFFDSNAPETAPGKCCEMSALESANDNSLTASSTQLREGVDYIIENGLFVFTKSYLASQEGCCGSGCRNCPYTSNDQ